ncbi:MAG TPA: efflux RND transporter periplasmic adaptor subunit [Gemmataceae bacterium]|nr:efflux RND transporter periplasmic adaptor subunit [Gemmataceae bacterium]
MRPIVFALLLLSLTAAGCSEKAAPKPAIKRAEVLVTPAVTDTIIDYEEFTGRTESKSMIEVKARATGYLDKVHFKDGDTVKEDDLLFEIDPRPYQTEVAKADAALYQAETKFRRLDTEYQRAKTLQKANAISPEEFDRVSGDRGEAEAAIRVAKASLEMAKLNLEFTKVTVRSLDNGGKIDPKNPRTGRVSRRLKDPGNLVKADETLLATIVTLDPMYVYFDVDERTVLTMRNLIAQKKIKSVNEMTFRFEFANDAGTFPYEGKIDFEDNKLDTSTGTLQLRGVIKNHGSFSHGQFVRIRLFVGAPRSAVLIPERALGTDQGQKFLYVVKQETDKDGQPAFKADYRGGADLQLGALRDGRRVIEKGVQPGEMVIWSGLQRIRKDASITAKRQDPPQTQTPQVAAK